MFSFGRFGSERDMKSDLPERTFVFAERIVRLCVFLERNGRVSTTLATQLLRSDTFGLVDVIQTDSSVARADDWIRTSMDLFTRQVPFSVEPHRRSLLR